MRAMVRLLLCAVAAVAVFVGAAWGVTCWHGGALADLDLAGAGRSLMAEVHKRDALEAHDDAVRCCVLGKEAVIEDLYGERLSARQAADRFRELEDELQQTADGDPDSGRAGGFVADDDESVYANVLQWAVNAAAGRPDRAARLAQIETEVNALLHRGSDQRA